jgi:shikimate dehydrogenase
MKALYGLIGYPVKHSVSPAMHNAAFKTLGINAEYKLFEVAPQELGAFLVQLNTTAIRGFNVTIPYKERVLESVELPKESLFLKTVGAINTVVRKEGQWRGFNTDIPGFLKDLSEKKVDPKNKRIAILGAGGAGRALAYALASKKAADITLFDTDAAKVENAISMIAKLFPQFPIRAVESVADLNLKQRDILINATPVGLKASDPCLVDSGDLHRRLFVYDLIYNPMQTKLLQEGQRVGAQGANGLGMLVYQGAISFKHFTGFDAPVDVMREAALKALAAPPL